MLNIRQSEILVADDDGVMRTLLHALLTQAGYRVHLAADGDDALAQCGRHGASPAPAALALLDMTMPNRDGISTCRSLRQLPGWRLVPIVMVTACGTDRAVRAALNAGIDGFVVKPFSSQDLLQRVAFWVNSQALGGQNQAGPSAASQELAGPQPAGPLPPALLATGTPAPGVMPGVAWNIGWHGMGTHERGQTRDISHLLRARSGLQPL